MPSIPVSDCSSTWVTLFSTVSADAPGYPAEMFTLGVATSGYCATGSARIAATPARMMMIDITHANTGRLAKNRASMLLPRPRAGARSTAGARGGSGSRRTRRRARAVARRAELDLGRLDRHAGPDLVEALDDQL